MGVKFSSEKSESKADNPLAETVQLVKEYARQETLGPLKGWARYLGFGAAGSLVLGIGFVIAAVGVLRLLQTETTAFSGPSTSIIAYLITLAVCIVVIALTVWQISRRTSLQRKEDAS
jgi:predicted cobalt transporter CbtA